MSPLRIGIVAAAVIAGPPLWRMVQDGSMDATTAVERGGLVALACAVGASWLRGLVADYQADVRKAKERRARNRAIAQLQRHGGGGVPQPGGARADDPRRDATGTP